MATTKKKPATKSAAMTARKSTPKAAPKTVRKTTTKPQKVAAEQSFRLASEKVPFMTFNFTIQSAYWLVLSALILGLGAWVMYLNVQIQNIYDQIELNTQLSETYLSPAAEKNTPDTAKPSL
jgi:uncharacterized protein HemX